MTQTLQIADMVSFRTLGKTLGVDRKAIAAIVDKHGLAVYRHPSLPNAKLLGPAEVAVIRRVLTPERRTD